MIILDCPGTNSESAGQVSACQGCPNQKICASGEAQLPDPGKLKYYYCYTFFFLVLILILCCFNH